MTETTDLLTVSEADNRSVEIVDGIVDTFCVPEYINESWLKEAPVKLYRLDRSGHRYYYELDDNGNPTFYTSVTTFIKQSLPTSPQLIDWMVTQGPTHHEKSNLLAELGTFWHIQCGELAQAAKYDLDIVRPKMEDYMHTHSLPHEFMSYTEEIKRDILSFAQWMVDYNVVPIAIEITLADRENGLAGSIDFIVEMDVQVKEPGEEVYKSGPRKGQKKEVKVNKRMNAIVDLKRGKKGFWQSHELQLIEYFNMWQMNFPDIPIHRLYNLAPMDWKKAPGYKMKDQTHSKAAKKLPHLIQTAKIEDATKNNSLTLCHGEIDIFKGLYANVETIELSELIKRKREFNS